MQAWKQANCEFKSSTLSQAKISLTRKKWKLINLAWNSLLSTASFLLYLLLNVLSGYSAQNWNYWQCFFCSGGVALPQMETL